MLDNFKVDTPTHSVFHESNISCYVHIDGFIETLILDLQLEDLIMILYLTNITK